MITCFDGYMLPCLHTLMITGPLTFYNFMLIHLDDLMIYAPTFKCFDNRMLTSIDIHTYDIHAHMCTDLDANMCIGLKAYVFMYLDIRTLKHFDYFA